MDLIAQYQEWQAGNDGGQQDEADVAHGLLPARMLTEANSAAQE
jgi:hypothetical protein